MPSRLARVRCAKGLNDPSAALLPPFAPSSSTRSGPLRIVHVLTRLLRAGAEENTLATCEHQIRTGAEVYLVHGREYDSAFAAELNPAIRRVSLHELVHPVNPLMDLQALRAMRKLFQQIQPDIVHTHQSKAGILGRLAADTRRSLVVHTVHIAHFENVSRWRECLYVALERYCAKHTHAIISVSQGVSDACLRRRIGVASQHVVVHSGMDIECFSSLNPAVDWTDFIDRWPLPDKPFVVLMLAAFEPRKRQAAFIDAMAPILRRQPQICVLLCGQGPTMADCRTRVKQLGLDTQLRLPGHVDRPAEYIALADLCVLTSEREGLPRVLVQYAAAGKPMVVNQLAGIGEVARDGINALVTPAGDITASAKAVEQLYLNHETRSRLQRAACSIDVSAWDIRLMGTQIDSVYEQGWQGMTASRLGSP